MANPAQNIVADDRREGSGHGIQEVVQGARLERAQPPFHYLEAI
ncbi:MAG: hypothetical protein AB7G75_02770 [Candidatus Binatia bacterium]